MPGLTLHLLRLSAATSREDFLIQLLQCKPAVDVVVASRPQHWVCKPEKKDVNDLTGLDWDLMLLIKSPKGEIPSTLRSRVLREYKVTCGIPSKLLANYPETNKKLLSNARNVPLTGSLDNVNKQHSSQNLEASPDLLLFADELMKEHPGPVTMLNLLHFKQDGKASYAKYGQVCPRPDFLSLSKCLTTTSLTMKKPILTIPLSLNRASQKQAVNEEAIPRSSATSCLRHPDNQTPEGLRLERRATGGMRWRSCIIPAFCTSAT